MKLTKAHIPAILWTLFIASSCLLPASTLKRFAFDSLFEIDKLLHVVLYFVFVVLWAVAYPREFRAKQKFSLAIISISYGVLIEVLQSVMSLGRAYEIDDIIANTFGCLVGIMCATFMRRKLPLLKNRLPFLRNLY